MKAERILLLVLVTLLGVGCLLVLLPFLPAMAWAGILVFCTWPIFAWLCRHVRPGIAAAAITIAVAALVMLPLVHLALVAAKEVRDAQHWVHNAILFGLPPAPGVLNRIPMVGQTLTDAWNNSSADLGSLTDEARPYLGMLAHSGLTVLLALSHGLIGAVVALFIAFFFYISGARIADGIRRLLARVLSDPKAEQLVTLIAATVRGVVYGILGTAAMQGALYALAFEVARTPQPLILASLCGLVSIVPAGATVVYVPLCLYLAAKGRVLAAILLAAYSFIVVGGADSIIRPWLIARGASLPYIVTLIGVLGGAIAFGALGIFLGPVLLALGLAIAEEFARLPRGAWRNNP